MIGQTGQLCCCGSVGGSTGIPTTNCSGCCSASNEFATVDLGAGGLTSGSTHCTGTPGCPDIAGVFDADWDGGCAWSYSADWCNHNCTGCTEPNRLTVRAAIVSGPCRLTCDVSFGSVSCGPDVTCVMSAITSYSYTFGSTTTSCSGTYTLSKTAEDWSTTCGGALPATISVTL